jgi:hypothetical protein
VSTPLSLQTMEEIRRLEEALTTGQVRGNTWQGGQEGVQCEGGGTGKAGAQIMR